MGAYGSTQYIGHRGVLSDNWMLMDTLMLGRRSGPSVSHPGLFDSHYAMLHIGMTFPLSPAALSLPLGH